MRTLALILAGRANERLGALTQVRAEAAVPFAGKFRIIDFALSNCVNSQIFNVAVLTQYLPRSLSEHIGVGKPWELDRARGGVRVFQPYLGPNVDGWEKGSADAVHRHLDFIEKQRVDTILVLGGSHVYTMDYRPLLQFHQESGADVTLGVRHVDITQSERFGMVSIDSSGRVTNFIEKPNTSQGDAASMGVYVFNSDVLKQHFEKYPEHLNFGSDVLPTLVQDKRVYAYEYDGFWADVSTLPAYWSANMAMLSETPAVDLHNPKWTIHTRSEERPPAKVGLNARVSGNLISNGAIVDGVIENSVISPGVTIAEGATVINSVIMNNCQIQAGAVVENAILDKNVTVGNNVQLKMELSSPQSVEVIDRDTEIDLHVVRKGSQLR